MKAFSYLRVSGKGQVLGDGFPRQREAIEKYAKANSLVIEEEFRDEGVKGTTELADRDGLARLLDRIESNGVRTVLVERSDRVARDLLVGEVILGQFRDLGVTVIEAASGNELTADDADTLCSQTGLNAIHGLEELETQVAGIAVLYTPHSPAEGRVECRDVLQLYARRVAQDPWDGDVAREQRFLQSQ